MVQIEFQPNTIRIRTSYAQKDRCSAIPGGKWVPKLKAWEYLLTPATASAIYQSFNKDLQDKDKEILKALADRLMLAMAVKNECRELQIPDTQQVPWHHQLVSYNMAMELMGLNDETGYGGGAMLGLDMGCGKSKCAIDLICNHPDKIQTVLIACPHAVIDVWTGNDLRIGEFEKHATPERFKNLSIIAIEDGTIERKTKRAEAMRLTAYHSKKQLVCVINYESIWREPFASWAQAVGFDLVIGDELHRIKSASGKASKFFARLAHHAKYRIGLTGTPLPHALASNSKVLTPNGWKEIGHLCIDDLVIGSNGIPTRIAGVWPQGKQPLFEILFSDGAKIICTGDHLWNVISRGRRSRNLGYLTLPTNQLSKSRPLPHSNNKPRNNGRNDLFDLHGAPRWSIPLVSPVQFASNESLPIDPYLLGVLLGDGHIGNNVDFTTADQGIVDEVIKLLPEGLQLTEGHQDGKALRYRITSGLKGGSLKGKKRGPKPNPLMEILDALKLKGSRSHNKFIPAMYLWSNIDERLSLLQGLCDTDGCSYASTSKFTTTSRQLADDVTFLIQSLGGMVNCYIEYDKTTVLPNKTLCNGRTQYNLFFRMLLNPFRLARKAEKFIVPWRNISRNIMSVCPYGQGDATCITVDATDGLYVVEDFIVTHNSPLDIYGQYRFLDPGIFGTSYSKFRANYAVMGGFEGKQVLSYRNIEQLHDKMFLIAHRVMSKDVFDLPAFQDTIRTCKLSTEERRLYQSMDEEFCAELESGVVTAANALVKLLRLQEITSGYCNHQLIGTSKRALLKDVLEDFDRKEPLIVFARFTNDLQGIQETVEGQGRRYAELSGHENSLARWQNGDADVLGVQIKSGREGVDFTRARYSIYYSLGFSLGDYDQSRKRTDRPGQTREGMYIHLLAEDTVDYKVMKALDAHAEVISSVLNQYQTNPKLN